MKSYAWIPFVLLLGLVIGGWGTRSELRRAKAELDEARRQLRLGGGAGGAAGVRDVTRMLGIAEGGAEPAARGGAPGDGAAAPLEQRQAASTGAVASAPGGRETPPAPGKPLDGKARMAGDIERAMDLWRVRSDMARSAFIASAGLKQEEAARFDVAMAAMNLRLQNGISNWVESVKDKPQIGQEEGVRLLKDVTESLVLTYDELDRSMPPNWREYAEDADGRHTELTDFIDPAVAKPLVDVGDKLGGARWHHGRGDGGKEPGEDVSP